MPRAGLGLIRSGWTGQWGQIVFCLHFYALFIYLFGWLVAAEQSDYGSLPRKKNIMVPGGPVRCSADQRNDEEERLCAWAH